MQRFPKNGDFNLGIFDLVVCYGFVLFVSLSLVYLFSAFFCPICISSFFLGFESVVFFIASLTSFCFILIFSRVECIRVNIYIYNINYICIYIYKHYICCLYSGLFSLILRLTAMINYVLCSRVLCYILSGQSERLHFALPNTCRVGTEMQP